MTGTRLGHYEILALIGAGGMGEVWRARDTKLNRDVAIKILPEAFAQDADRMARFAREAQVLASLNHPYIAAIYGVEERALVMELVEGRTLVGPLPLEEALPIARQIAEALEYAHENGIVHRDLKPANVKVTPDGRVKILDFGLAKAIAGEPAAASNPANSPTITMGGTVAGVILGTAAYMSPEQARGKPVDKRADIWAFGVVLYEMLTGRNLFFGETVSDTLAAVLKEEPDWSALPADTPQPLRTIMKRCLERDPRQRLRDIGEARIALDPSHGAATVPPDAAVLRRRAWPWISAAVISALAALGLAFVHFTRPVIETYPVRFSVSLPEKTVFHPALGVALSSDGRRLAFVGTSASGTDQLWIRDLDSLTARPVAGSEGASDPFFSPDGRSVAFFASGSLKRSEIAGGPAITICAVAGVPMGGTWSQTGVIVFGASDPGGLSQVPAVGGTPKIVTSPDSAARELFHRYPWFLPDGHRFLYAVRNLDRDKSTVWVADLNSAERHLILSADSSFAYSPPGFLLFSHDRTLMAQAFDTRSARPAGDAAPVAEQVDFIPNISKSIFAVSATGVLAYSSGGLGGGDSQLTWFDRSGKATGVLGSPGRVSWAAISPDGRTVAVERLDRLTNIPDIWLHDLARGTETRLTSHPKGGSRTPIWSGDSSSVAYYSSWDGSPKVYRRAIDGSGAEETLSALPYRAGDWSRDGKFLVLEAPPTERRSNLKVMPLFGERKVYPLLNNGSDESAARISPDGKWIAFVSTATGRNEVYVTGFPVSSGRTQISTTGGSNPFWSRNSDELYYVSPTGALMSVGYRAGPRFEAQIPKQLFQLRISARSGIRSRRIDVSKEGRFLIPADAEASAPEPLTVILNWLAVLKR